LLLVVANKFVFTVANGTWVIVDEAAVEASMWLKVAGDELDKLAALISTSLFKSEVAIFA
jgi:hypothetical protein